MNGTIFLGFINSLFRREMSLALDSVDYNHFSQSISQNHLKKIAEGSSLSALVDEAEKAVSIITKAFSTDDLLNVPKLQVMLDRISEVKMKIAVAIVYKQIYYETTWLGKVTKFILKLFCLWNGGYTSAIVQAEDFLLFWDSRLPVAKLSGEYLTRYFFPLVPVYWVQENLDMSKFYNYNPSRPIYFKGGLSVIRRIDKEGNFLKFSPPPGFINKGGL